MTILSKSTLSLGILTLGLAYPPATAMERQNDFDDFDRMMMRPITGADFLRVINANRAEGERYRARAITAKRTRDDAALADNEGPTPKKLKVKELKQSLIRMKNYCDIGIEDQTSFQEFPLEIKSIINHFMLFPNFVFKDKFKDLYTGNPGQLAIMTKSILANNTNSYPGEIQWFVVAQQWNVANFTAWDLSHRHMALNDIRILAKALQKNRTLTVLNLSHTSADDADVCHIAKMLKKNNTLKELNFSSNQIQDAGFSSLITVLALYNSTLSHLDLSRNHFNPEICYSLGMLIEKNTSLTCLKLNNFCWSYPLKMSPLAKGLKKNSTLTELSLLGNSINADQVEILLDALKKNSTLKKLTLYYPNVEGSSSEEDSSDEEEISSEDSSQYSDNHDEGVPLMEEFREQYGDRVNFYA